MQKVLLNIFELIWFSSLKLYLSDFCSLQTWNLSRMQRNKWNSVSEKLSPCFFPIQAKGLTLYVALTAHILTLGKMLHYSFPHLHSSFIFRLLIWPLVFSKRHWMQIESRCFPQVLSPKWDHIIS
jgi:hypothetical protein